MNRSGAVKTMLALVLLVALCGQSSAQQTAEAYYLQGKAHVEQHRWQEAVESFKQVIVIKRDHAQAHNDLGIAYVYLGRMRDAIKAFKRAVDYKPDFIEASFNLGQAYEKLDRYEDAIEAYRVATKVKRNYAAAYYRIANSYLKLGNKGLALVECDQLKEIDSELARQLFEEIFFVKAGDAAPAQR